MKFNRWSCGVCLVLVCCAWFPTSGMAADPKPNIIFVLADDLGYGDLGCYGGAVIQTPCLDRMSAEGMRFTDFYAGSTVCAPSRCVLMTGRHLGNARVRGNAANPMHQSLLAEDVTVAEALKTAGYTTALIGKWGLGEPGTPGLPNDQGFDYFFGYLSQTHAHNYYPESLWLNREKVFLRNEVQQIGSGLGGAATKKVDYSHDLFVADALQYIRDHQAAPFFLYLALTTPHANNEARGAHGDGQEVPDYGQYADLDWPNPDKGQAAMVSRMDRDMGRIFDLLKALDLDERTLVIFSSDNGPHREGGNDLERFRPSGPFRGIKRALYEGGIRVPMIARWPGRVPEGSTSSHIGYFGDWMATACEIAGIAPPEEGLDSISFLPALTGRAGEQAKHPYLYWEFYEQGSRQAVRDGVWKAIRQPMFEGVIELYRLDLDPGEERDLASGHPEVVRSMGALMDAAHTPSANWRVRR